MKYLCDIFISYSEKDKEITGDIKKALESYGLRIFLAHADITPSKEWVETIKSYLKSSEFFIPFLSENFRGSEWTDQESGIAIAYNRKILPLIYLKNPHGFLKDYQAVRLGESTSKNIENIVNAIRKEGSKSIKVKIAAAKIKHKNLVKIFRKELNQHREEIQQIIPKINERKISILTEEISNNFKDFLESQNPQTIDSIKSAAPGLTNTLMILDNISQLREVDKKTKLDEVIKEAIEKIVHKDILEDNIDNGGLFIL